MSDEQVAPETKGVTVTLLSSVDLGPEIEGMAGRQLRMRMVTIEPGNVFGPIHNHKDRPGTVYMASPRTMGREWAGPRIGTPRTGLRTGDRFRRWKSRSISSCKGKLRLLMRSRLTRGHFR
jgi:hypothetical protein